MCALLAAKSPEHSVELLPAAVHRATELAEQMRDAIRLRSGSTDPLLKDLVAALEPAATAHERFVTTWAETDMLSGITQDMLEADVCALMRTVASVIRVVADAAATSTTARPAETIVDPPRPA